MRHIFLAAFVLFCCFGWNRALQGGMATRMASGKVGLHGWGGLGACGGAAVALVSGLDLPAGEAGASIGAERGLWQCSARNQARDLFPMRHIFLAAFVLFCCFGWWAEGHMFCCSGGGQRDIWMHRHMCVRTSMATYGRSCGHASRNTRLGSRGVQKRGPGR